MAEVECLTVIPAGPGSQGTYLYRPPEIDETCRQLQKFGNYLITNFKQWDSFLLILSHGSWISANIAGGELFGQIILWSRHSIGDA